MRHPKTDDEYRQYIQTRVTVNESGCWLYRGSLGPLGYAQVYRDGRRWMAHRLTYTLWRGEIPEGMQVCHSCDVRHCLNPDHLWLGTNLQNQLDSIAKRRHANLTKTHCPNGHEYTPENTRLRDGVKRECKTCNRIRLRRRAGWPESELLRPVIGTGKKPVNAPWKRIRRIGRKAKTHCKHGHPLSGDNLYITPGDGRRQCRICRNEGQRRLYQGRQNVRRTEGVV